MVPLAQWISDAYVEDIIMNRPNEVFIKRGSTTTRHEITVDFIDQQGIAILAAALEGQNVWQATPLLSCELPGGTRLQAVLPPCVDDGTSRWPSGGRSLAPTLDQLAGAASSPARSRSAAACPGKTMH